MDTSRGSVRQMAHVLACEECTVVATDARVWSVRIPLLGSLEELSASQYLSILFTPRESFAFLFQLHNLLNEVEDSLTHGSRSTLGLGDRIAALKYNGSPPR